MDNEKIKLEEQQAPLKNTDHAFVQVSEDGSPAIPKGEKEGKTENPHDGQTTDPEKR